MHLSQKRARGRGHPHTYASTDTGSSLSNMEEKQIKKKAAVSTAHGRPGQDEEDSQKRNPFGGNTLQRSPPPRPPGPGELDTPAGETSANPTDNIETISIRGDSNTEADSGPTLNRSNSEPEFGLHQATPAFTSVIDEVRKASRAQGKRPAEDAISPNSEQRTAKPSKALRMKMKGTTTTASGASQTSTSMLARNPDQLAETQPDPAQIPSTSRTIDAAVAALFSPAPPKRRATKEDAKELLQTACSLEKLISLVKNTEKNTKSVIARLVSQIRAFNSNLEEYGFEQPPAQIIQCNCPTPPPPPPCPKCSSGELTREDVREKLQGARGPKELTELFNLKWPDSAYLTTTLTTSSFITENDTPRVALLDMDCPKDAVIFEQLKQQFPGLAEVRGALDQGRTAILRNNPAIQIIGEDEAHPRPRILAIRFLPLQLRKKSAANNEEEAAPNEGSLDEAAAENTLLAITELAEQIATNPLLASPVTFMISTSADIELTRKMLEATLLASPDCRVKLCTKGRRLKEKRNVKPRKNKLTSITINPGQLSYADAVGRVQSSVDPSLQGIRVAKISETTTGQIRVLVSENTPEAAQTFAETIKQRTQLETRSAPLRKETALIIRDLPTDASPNALRRALTEGLCKPEEVQLQNFRPTKAGDSSCIARLPPDAARRHLTRGSVQLGWTNCRLSELVKITQCLRCLSFDHPSHTCPKAPSHDLLCCRCGETGHVAKTCSAVPSCYVCKISGHFATTTACPAYRARVEALRSKKPPSA